MSRRSSRRVRPSSPTSRSTSLSSHPDGDLASSDRAVTAAAAGHGGFGIESLERRVLFAADMSTIGDPTSTSLSDPANSGVFEFQQGSPAETIRVSYQNVVAQLVGLDVNAMDGVSNTVDLVPASLTPPTDSPNLFKIYIAASDLTSFISVSVVNPVTTSFAPRHDIPFSGSAGGLLVNNASSVGSPTVTVTTVGGGVLIGDKHNGTTDTNVPIAALNMPGNAIGIYPGSGTNNLTAGIEMSPTNLLTGAPNDIGELLIGGTILGSVSFPAAPVGTAALGASQGGNVGLFYAGEVLTGDATGVLQAIAAPASSQTPNFTVGGDLRDFYTYGDIGGDPNGQTVLNGQYFTGFDMTVAGTLGDLYQNSGNFLGTMDVQHSASVYGLPETLYPETEVEYQNKSLNIGDVFQGNLIPIQVGAIETSEPKLDAPFTNDSAADPQYLSSLSSASSVNGALVTNNSGVVQYSAYVAGNVQASLPDPESNDFYAVPALAGETLTITLDDLTGGLVDARLIDPSGHVVATDESNVNPALTETLPFAYTADRPGIYTVDVKYIGGGNFDAPYTLEIGGVGNLALSALSTPGSIYDGGYDGGFEYDQGDLGALIAGANLATGTAEGVPADLASTPSPATTIDVSNGSVRDLTAASIGVISADGTSFGEGPFLLIPNGELGLVEATSVLGILDLETNYDPTEQYGHNSYDPGQPIGGDIQEVNGAGTVFVNAATNEGIGEILAGSMATDTASFIDVNADNTGNDGVIDLIDVSGDLGTINAGGPEIVTHDGGDVRYMVVGGNVYQDSFFDAASFPSQTEYQPGEAVSITDDSGTTMTLTPTGGTATTVIDSSGNTTTVASSTQLTLQTYGIRDKGGVVIISATSTGGLTITSNGTSGNNSQTEIGTISVTGTAAAVELGETSTTSTNGTTVTNNVDANGEQTYADTTNEVDANGDPLFNVILDGTASTDVFNIVVTGETNINSIENLTQGGEIGGISAGSIGTILSYGTIGLLKSDTGAAIIPLPTPQIALVPPGLGNDYGFSVQTTGIVALGNVYAIEAYEGLGNIFVSGSIQQVTANANGKLSGNGFEGIDAPVVAVGSVNEAGRILNVSIGQGILPSGTGNVAFSGIFAQNDIGTVTNNNVAGADVRGDIVSATAIDNIALGNGSIINSTVAVFSAFDQASVLMQMRVLPGIDSPITAPVYAIKNVAINGSGGILGTLVVGYAIGNISVSSKGFGILNDAIEASGVGTINSIIAGGYGVRDTLIQAGSNLNTLSATGNGSELSVATFGTDVRESESTSVDPFFGTTPNPLTDLDAFFGTSAATPTIAGVTDTGVLEDVLASGTTTLGNVSAQTIRTAAPLLSAVSPLNPNIPVLGTVFPMSLSFAANTVSIKVRGIIDGLQITTGTLGRFLPGGSVSRCGISVSGAINKLVIHGNFGQTFTSPFSGLTVPDSYIDAIGVNGVIGSLKVFGSLNGDVVANSNIGSISITGNVVGSITINGQTNGLALNSLFIGGKLTGGSLVIDGSVNSITTSGSLGELGDNLTVTGSLKSLSVGSNHGLKGSDLALNLNVEEGLGKLTVFGRIDGAVTVAGNLGKLQVTNDGSTSNAINGAINVGGAIATAKIINGSVDADITANNDIDSFMIQNGVLMAGDVLTSRIGTLKKFSTSGALVGSIDAPDSVNSTILIGSAFGDGLHAASIALNSASLIRIGGAVAAGTTITTTSTLKSIAVGDGLAATAVITGNPIVKQKISGVNNGTVNTG